LTNNPTPPTLPTVSDNFSYDGYGMMLGGNPTPASPATTKLLYAGEQFDPSLGHYYLRARYYNPNNGRFSQMDSYEGSPSDPQSLHKYLYCHANPVNGIDPSGQFFTYMCQMATWLTQKILRGIDAGFTLATRAYLTVSAMASSLMIQLRYGLDRFYTILYQYATNTFGFIVRIPQSVWQKITDVFSRTQGLVSQSQAAQSGFNSHTELVEAWGKIIQFTSNTRVHHFVEQGRGVVQFGLKAIHSIANSVPLRQDLHQLISNFYSSGVNLLQFMEKPPFCNYRLLRDYVSSLSWQSQWQWGKAVYDYVIMNGSMSGFNPANYGL
jgi:RHS repeat-associated protein